jgi:hypothetical protein
METVSRNGPCPCGSGRRFKDCHGALAGDERRGSATIAPAAPEPEDAKPRPSYRPQGPDWAHLSEAEREECGLLMERALKRQKTHRLDGAIELYSAVLARAPDTHDALHMLGAIALQRNELDEARRYLTAAMALRPPYPEIEHNLAMLHDMERAELARRADGRRSTEEFCERALPALADLALRPAGGPAPMLPPSADGGDRPEPREIHIIAGVCPSSDRAEWLVMRIAELLAPDRPTIWTAHPERYADCHGATARVLAPDVASSSRGGCLVFVGIDVDCEWIRHAEAGRVVVFCQPARPSQYLDQLRAIALDGARPIDLIFPSRAMAARFDLEGSLLPPPIALEAYRSHTDGERDHPVAPLQGVTVGVIGRNWPFAATSVEGAFLRRIAAAAGKLEVYDPGPLRYFVGGDAAVRCHARSEANLRRILDSADVLLHAVDQWWLEGDGRELVAAMAAGVPVICPRSSIFAEYIDHAVDGLLYDRREEAERQVAELRRAPARAVTLGRAARAKMEHILDHSRMASAVREFVLGGISPEEVRRAPRAAAGL